MQHRKVDVRTTHGNLRKRRGPSQWVPEKLSVKAPLPLEQPLKLLWAKTFRVAPLRVEAMLEKVNTPAGQLLAPEVGAQTRLRTSSPSCPSRTR